MKALIFYDPGNCLVKNIPTPKISEEELLVQVKYAGVCGTDVRIYKGTKKVKSPRIIGHEFAGKIVSVGTNVKEFRKGDRVTVYPVILCGECYACKRGRRNICVNRKTLGYELDGAFAEYIKIPQKAIQNGNVLKLPDNVTYEEGAISEPIAAAYHGIEQANLKEGDSVVIVGAGPIGLSHTMLLKLKKPSQIIVSEPDEHKRDLALKLGADQAINPLNEKLREKVFEFTDLEGADVVLVDVGDARVIGHAIDFLKKGGTCVLFAGCPSGTKISLDPNIIHYREIILTGSSASTPENQKKILDLISSGNIDAKVLITAIMSLDEWQKAFEMKADYKQLKSILKI